MTYAGQLWDYFPHGGPRYFGAFYDFLSDQETDAAEWTKTNITGTLAFTTMDTLNGGWALVDSGDATTAHGGSVQPSSGNLFLAVNTTTEMVCKLRAYDATGAAYSYVGGWSVGLRSATAAAIDTANNGVYFRKDVTNADLSAAIHVGSGTATLNTDTGYDTAPLTAATELGMRIVMGTVSGTGEVFFYADGREVVRYAGTGLPASTTILYPTILTVNQGSVRHQLYVDYIGWRQTRV